MGFGSLTTYASFNKFRHPTSRDALIISFADTFTSLLAGTVIFAILGHLAHETGQEVEDVVKSSAGLAFISYPEVLASFPASNFFSVVFFLMLITLGLGSAIGLLSSVTTTLNDSFPTIDKKTIIKLCCAVGFAIGIFYVTPGGMLMLDMVDHYGGTMLILGLASLEVIGIAWVYGTNVVTRDFNFMFETELSVYWRICWGFICPLLLPGLFIYLVFVDGGPFVEKDIAQTSKQTMAICGWVFSLINMCHHHVYTSPKVTIIISISTTTKWLTRYILAGAGLLFVPVHLLFTITAEEQGERFLVRLWNTIRSVVVSTNTNANANTSTNISAQS